MRPHAPIAALTPLLILNGKTPRILWDVKIGRAITATVTEDLRFHDDQRYSCYGRHDLPNHTYADACRHIDAVRAEGLAHPEYYRFAYPDMVTLEHLRIVLDQVLGEMQHSTTPVSGLGQDTSPPINPLEHGTLTDAMRHVQGAIKELSRLLGTRRYAPADPAPRALGD